MKYFNSSFSKPNDSFANTNSTQNFNAEFDSIFTIIPRTTPRIIRKCARCDANRFVSSDKFRLNASKKVIDVWLIFKCIACDYTLNISIISRRSVASIEQTLLDGFYENDLELAWRYAFDPAYIEKGALVDWEIEFETERQDAILKDQPCTQENHKKPTGSCLIKSQLFLKISISVILRKILNISRNKLDKMYAEGDIEVMSFQGKSLTLKNSIGLGCTIQLSDGSL